jgi:membrane protein implicated in regulation of membrane protease activity
MAVDFDVMRLALLAVVSASLLFHEWCETRRDARRLDDKVGKTGWVQQPIVAAAFPASGAPGLVVLDGELWRATADSEIPKGTQVRVTRVSGLTVHVVPEK